MSFFTDVFWPVFGEAAPFFALIALVLVIRWGFDRAVDHRERAKHDSPVRWK